MVFLSHKNWGATQPLEVPALRALKGLWEQSSVCERLPIPPALANWLVLVLVALPHILYAFIWLLPRLWRNAFGKRAVDVLASLGGICKILQFSAIAGWCWAGRPTGLCFNAADVALWQWLVFLALFSVGQSLNVAVFRTLGKYGVYYGYKLGHKIPYVYGYPFNFVSHPQYLGSVMTVWAFGALLHNQMPSGRVVLGCYWTLLYLLTAIQEDNF